MNLLRLFETAKIQTQALRWTKCSWKVLENILLKQALQFVGNFNVEAGIRQISKFGVVLDLKNNDEQFD